MDKTKSESVSFVLLMSLLRTATPVLVGTIIGWFTSQGMEVDPSFEVSLTAAITGASIFIYYAVVRVLEMKVSPRIGILLGSTASPDSYSPGRPPVDAAPNTTGPDLQDVPYSG